MGDKDAPHAPQLPDGAPADLRDFLDCKTATVTVKNGAISWWVPPNEIKEFVPEGVKPDLSIQPGGKPGTATVSVKLGPLELKLPASVQGGQLKVDTSDPPFWAPQKLIDGIDQSVKDLNDWFKHKGNGIGPPAFGNGTVKLTKVALAPGTGQAVPAPLPGQTTDKLKPQSEPPAPPAPEPKSTVKLPEPEPYDPDPEHDGIIEKPKLPPYEAFGPYAGGKNLPPAPGTTTTPSVIGAGGPGGLKSPAGLGDLARRYLVGIVIAAVLVAGGFILVGAPALGLFGAAPEGAVATTPPGATPEPAPTPTPTPTPEGVTVRSDDGLAMLTIPNGAIPPGTTVSITARGQADAPPELEGVTFRSSFYDVMPAGLRFALPATFERTVDVSTLGFDFEAVGYPAIALALRDSDAKWSWLGGQSFRVGGLDGLGPENELVQAAQLDRTGDVFGFGGQLFVQLVSYPESGANLLIGQPSQIVVKVTAPSSEGTDTRITALAPFASLPGIVDFGDKTLSEPVDGIQTAELSLTCRQEGDLVSGFDLELTPGVSSELLDRLGLGQPPATQVTFSTSIHCVDTLPAVEPVLIGGCVNVVHTPVEGGYPSHLHWRFDFEDSPPPAAGTTLELAYAEGASSIVYDDLPIAGTQAAFDTGITQYGTKTFQRLIAHGPDGTTTDLTTAFMETFGSSANVTSSELNLAGNRCGG